MIMHASLKGWFGQGPTDIPYYPNEEFHSSSDSFLLLFGMYEHSVPLS